MLSVELNDSNNNTNLEIAVVPTSRLSMKNKELLKGAVAKEKKMRSFNTEMGRHHHYKPHESQQLYAQATLV